MLEILPPESTVQTVEPVMLLGEPWMLEASCRQLPPGEADRLFFADTVSEAALEVCTGCPVSLECFLYGFRVEVEGILAGTMKEQRA